MSGKSSDSGRGDAESGDAKDLDQNSSSDDGAENDNSLPTKEQSSKEQASKEQASKDETDANKAGGEKTKGNARALPGELPCFHVVGLGASAGGLEPLETFFENTPTDSGMAFVIIQHLSPDFKSQMDQLLARKTSLPIVRVKNREKIKADHIYLIPPKKIMIVSNGHLLLTDKDDSAHLTHPIDEFFRSLANDFGRHSIGIILSGTGADGSKGCMAIEKAGGLVLAQDENSAAFDGMPLSAVATGAVHLQLPPRLMPEAITRYVSESLSPEALKDDEMAGNAPELMAVFKLLKSRYKIDFQLYKLNTIGRRIKRRMQLTRFEQLEDYIEVLKNKPEELENLYHDLLIGVTRFFRDKEFFNILESQVFPKLASLKKDQDTIRIWVVGCATGEEAYSIGIVALEFLRSNDMSQNVKIFATDVHANSIKQAGMGRFTEESIAAIPSALRAKYIRRTQGGYGVIPEVRKSISFATHNVITDAPFTKIDMISCRNMLIYLQPTVQKKVMSLFHFSLAARGVLCLGTSETIGELAEEFEELSSRFRVYVKKRDVRLPLDSRVDFRTQNHYLSLHTPGYNASYNAESDGNEQRSLLTVYDRLLNQFIPPAFLLDEKFNLVHSFGGGERFLKFGSGRTSVHFLDLVEDEARTSFAGALNHVVRNENPVQYTGITLRDHLGEAKKHRVSIQPIQDQKSRSTYFFIKLTEQELEQAETGAEEVSLDEVTQERVNALEAELRYSQENLQATIEELETANEEMQASNEELVASNEELQSTNEELQSVNEELHTVNTEYHQKIWELTRANDDMDNLLATTRVGVVFLDKELCIRRYTPEIGRLFHLLPQDIGRSILGFSHSLQFEKLEDRLREVYRSGNEFEGETTDRQDQPFIIRILPYRATESGETEGVLLTLIDIQKLRSAEDESQQFKTISDLTSDGNLLVDEDGNIEYANPAFKRLTNLSGNSLDSLNLYQLLPEFDEKRFKKFFKQSSIELQKPFETILQNQQGSHLCVEVNATSLNASPNKKLLFLNLRDVSERKESERELLLHTLALESATDGIFVLENSKDYKFTYHNPAFRRITGYTEASINQANVKILFPQDTDSRELELVKECLAVGEELEIVYQCARSDGSKFWNELRLSPVKTDNDKVDHFVGICCDVTLNRELRNREKESARKTQLLLNSTEEGIYFVDRQGKCGFCNLSAARLLGYESSSDLVGRDMHGLIHHSTEAGDEHPLGKSLIAQSIASGEALRSDKEVFWKKDGTSFPVEYWSHPVTNEEGAVEGSVVTFIDITERRENNERLQAAQTKAELANRSKSIFLANVSHELRTPLSAILGYIELLQSDMKSTEGREKLSVLERNSLHLLDLLNDLLDLSKIESGFMTVEREETDLKMLFNDIDKMMRPRAAENNLSLTIDVKESVPRYIVSDAVRFKQIVVNLVGNAIKFSDAGDVGVEVGMREFNGSEQLCVTVTDNGQGIPEDERERLFEPFKRGENPVKSGIQGTGLGLSIARELARRMGGDIDFDSTVGLGSQFRFYHPSVTHQSGTLDTGELVVSDEFQRPVDQRHLDAKVLVVDDNEDIRRCIEEILRQNHASCISVESGEQCIALLTSDEGEEFLPEIVLMDINMPGLGGIKTVKRLREDGVTIPIIAVTARAMKGQRESLMEVGFNDYVSKPFSTEKILAVIAQHLEGSESENKREGVEKATAVAASSKLGATSTGDTESNARRILVVDDSVDAASAMSALLDARGYKTHKAFNGQSALDVADDFLPQAVLLDLTLPDIDGFAVMHEMKSNPKLRDTYFIAATGHSEPELIKKAEQEGFHEFLVKPVDASSVDKALQRLLGTGKETNSNTISSGDANGKTKA